MHRKTHVLSFLFAIVALILGSAAPAAAQEWAGVRRAYANFNPYVGLGRPGVPGEGPQSYGAVFNLGLEVNLRCGFLIGAELSPLTVDLAAHSYAYGARLNLGYTSRSLALAVGLGNGVGAMVRIGRFDGTYAIVRLLFAARWPVTLPQDISIDASHPLTRRLRLTASLGGGFTSLLSARGLVGVQYQLGGTGLSGTHVLSAGAGVSWAQLALGPTISLGYERRF